MAYIDSLHYMNIVPLIDPNKKESLLKDNIIENKEKEDIIKDPNIEDVNERMTNMSLNNNIGLLLKDTNLKKKSSYKDKLINKNNVNDLEQSYTNNKNINRESIHSN